MVILSTSLRPPEIMLIDDNRGDVKLMEIAFRRTLPHVKIIVAPTAEHGMSLLRGEDAAARPTAPDIVFLDLNLPSMHGLTFLELMKKDPHLTAIPVLVVSSSSADKDISESYRHHASGFVTKPFNLDGYDIFADQIASYWFSFVQLPRGAARLS